VLCAAVFCVVCSGTTVRRVAVAGAQKGPLRVFVKGSEYPGLAISRAFGDTNAAAVGIVSTPDHTRMPITNAQHFILMASDGVWDQMSSAEAAKFIEAHKCADSACAALVQECASRWLRRRGGLSDDISAVVVYLNAPHPPTTSSHATPSGTVTANIGAGTAVAAASAASHANGSDRFGGSARAPAPPALANDASTPLLAGGGAGYRSIDR
jgi:hypothetical protein